MEASKAGRDMDGGISLREWMEEKFRSYDSRLRSNHDSISKFRDKQGKQGETLVEINGKLEEQSNDIAELKEDMKWIKRGLFGAIAVGLMFVVGVFTVAIQLAS